jgi:hypothetical protein
MKDNGLLSGAEYSVKRLERLNLTDSQRRDAVTYEPGQIVEFHRMARGAIRRGVKEKRIKSGEQWQVLRREEGAVIVGKDAVEKLLPLDQAGKFSVFKRDEIAFSIGDRVRFTKNLKHRGQEFLNNDLRTVVGIDQGKIIKSVPKDCACEPCRNGSSAGQEAQKCAHSCNGLPATDWLEFGSSRRTKSTTASALSFCHSIWT